jgi:hypothetical protein
MWCDTWRKTWWKLTLTLTSLISLTQTITTRYKFPSTCDHIWNEGKKEVKGSEKWLNAVCNLQIIYQLLSWRQSLVITDKKSRHQLLPSNIALVISRRTEEPAPLTNIGRNRLQEAVRGISALMPWAKEVLGVRVAGHQSQRNFLPVLVPKFGWKSG